MNVEQMANWIAQRRDNPALPPPTEMEAVLRPLLTLLDQQEQTNFELRVQQQALNTYVRAKVNQLLKIVGTIPLRPEELDDESLVNLDPIGIVAETFRSVLENARATTSKLSFAMQEVQAILESVGGGVLVLDREKTIISHNSQFLKMLGKAGEEVVGRSCRDIICRGNPLHGCVFDRMIRQGRTIRGFFCGHDQNRDFNVVASPICDGSGEVVQVVLLYNDITELMEAKAAVSREKELIYQTLASIAEGVISTDKKGRVSLMNHVAEQLTGWSSSKAIGRPLCDVLKIFSEDDRNICLDVLDNVLLEERKEWVGRGASLQSCSGQKLPFAMSAASIRGQDGKEVMGSIVVFRDVTQEKKLEEEIAKRSRMESIGLLAGGIAHDFNNLLTAMLGNVSLAKMLVDRDGQIFELLSQAEMASTRARSLTQQLLTFAKGGKPVKCPVSLAPLLRECSGFTMSGSKVRCELELADELWDLELDKGQFGQVIQNLLLNAIQAMPKGGVVRVAAQNRAVRKESEEATLLPGKYVLITVRDQGTGIAPDNINRIFDPYYSTKETGHGLGLAICYSIIKNHHGAITVESEPGLGSTFSILLPAINHSAQAIDPESAAMVSTKRENKEKRVLIMDDETIICQVAVAMFKSLGWVAESCHDGKAAIVNYSEALAQGQPYDLVLMDLTIPGGMGGHETITELLALYPDASVLASSGYTNDPIMSDFSSYGFKGVLPKPYTMEMLTKALEKLLVA